MSNLTENQCALRGWTAIVPRHLGSCLPILMTQVAICCQLKLHVCGSWMPECQLSNVTKKRKTKKKKKKILPQKPWNKIHEYIRGTCDRFFFFFFFFFLRFFIRNLFICMKNWFGPARPTFAHPIRAVCTQATLHSYRWWKILEKLTLSSIWAPFQSS